MLKKGCLWQDVGWLKDLALFDLNLISAKIGSYQQYYLEIGIGDLKDDIWEYALEADVNQL